MKEVVADANRDFIERKEFDRICQQQGLEGNEAETALKVLDTLGVALYFPKLEYNDVVLNPEWLTKAIYFIIWASEKRGCGGKLSVETVKNLFDSVCDESVLLKEQRDDARITEDNVGWLFSLKTKFTYVFNKWFFVFEPESSLDDERVQKPMRKELWLDVYVPQDKYGFLLDLMAEFKLAFKLPSESECYCVPMLATTIEPPHDVPRQGGLHFSFRFSFLPSGLFFRFIAESGEELVDNLLWRQGAVLSWNDNRILVEYSEYHRTIELYAHGENPGEYLTLLRERLIHLIGASYSELPFEPSIITAEGDRIDWNTLVRRLDEEGSRARELTLTGSYLSMELFRQFKGYIDERFDGFEKGVRDELILMKGCVMGLGKPDRQNIHINVSPTISPSFHNTVQVENTVKGMTALCGIDNQLRSVKELLHDFEEDELDLVTKYGPIIKNLQRIVDRLRQDIAEAQAVVDNTSVAAMQRNSILERMQERWDKFAALSKQLEDVTGLGEKICKYGVTIAPLIEKAWDYFSKP